MNVTVNFTFEPIEDYIVANWAKLKNKSKKTNTLPDGEKYVVKQVSLKEIPLAILRKSGLLRLTDQEFHVCEATYSEISRDQGQKDKFLQKLFST